MQMKSTFILIFLFSAAAYGQAVTTIDAVNDFPYGANVGWLHWRGDTANGALPAYLLPSPQVPSELRKFVSSLSATGITGDGIPTDQVLNEEIVDQTKKGSRPG